MTVNVTPSDRVLAYRDFTRQTANDFTRNDRFYLLSGLVSEVGELADMLKKYIATGGSEYKWNSQKEAGLELGDLLWYLTRLADTHGLTLYDVMNMNEEKLRARILQGTILKRDGR
jgi:NTP pyrophosphatase (non-canonical NTP hydrolase)